MGATGGHLKNGCFLSLMRGFIELIQNDFWQELKKQYKAIADDTRREILKLLAKRDHSAGEIAQKFDISKPAISNH